MPGPVHTAERRFSPALHRLDRATKSPLAATAATAVSAAFLFTALLATRATPWLTAFEALAAAVTLTMVFVLQHTQARQQTALQLKLDEILRALPAANQALVEVENTPHLDLHEALRPLDER